MKTPDAQSIAKLLEDVTDPEIPVLSVMDLGIVRDIRLTNTGVEVDITPTYTGCPAMDVITVNIRKRLQEEGVEEVTIREVLTPPWTTDWLSAEGRKKLHKYGIAPPVDESADKRSLFGKSPVVACPQCGSEHTRRISQFGSTACKALYQCDDCQEPFDYFKCL